VLLVYLVVLEVLAYLVGLVGLLLYKSERTVLDELDLNEWCLFLAWYFYLYRVEF